MGARAPAADPLPDGGAAGGRRAVVLRARTGRGSAVHLPRDGDPRLLAGGDRAADGRAGGRPHRAQAAGGAVRRQDPLLQQARRDAHHLPARRSLAGRRHPAAVVPGAQEGRRHPRLAAGRRAGAVLQRRVRRRLWRDLRLLRRRLLLPRAEGLCRLGAPAAAAHSRRRQGGPDRRAGGAGLHRGAAPAAGAAGADGAAAGRAARRAERGRGRGRAGAAHRQRADPPDRRAAFGRRAARAARARRRRQLRARRHRDDKPRLRRSASREDACRGQRPARARGDRARHHDGQGRRHHRARPCAGAGRAAAAAGTTGGYRGGAGGRPAARRGPLGRRVHQGAGGSAADRARGVVRHPRPSPARNRARLVCRHASGSGGGAHHPAGAGADLRRHEPGRHQPAQDLARRADHLAGAAGRRRDHRRRDGGAEDGGGLRPPAGRGGDVRAHRDADAHRHADHRRRLPADRAGQLERRRVHDVDLPGHRAVAGGLVVRRGAVRAAAVDLAAQGQAEDRRRRGSARAVRHAVLSPLPGAGRRLPAVAQDGDRGHAGGARAGHLRLPLHRAAVLPRLEPARTDGRPVAGRGHELPGDRGAGEEVRAVAAQAAAGRVLRRLRRHGEPALLPAAEPAVPAEQPGAVRDRHPDACRSRRPAGAAAAALP